MNRSRWIIVAAVVVLAVSGVWWWKSRAAGAAPKYRTAEVDRGSVESVVSATGTINPVVQVEVGSQVSGTVEKLFADYNSKVRAGQVLLQLEQSSFRARLVQAEAAVAKAEASVKDGERTLARAQELFAKQYLAQAELDAAVVTLETRKADLKQAKAQLESAQVDLAHATIRAPIDGVVISRSIDLGQTVAASLAAPKLFVIANDLSRMQVETRIDEADIGQMRPGLPAVFTVDAFPDREFDGEVSQVRLEPIADQGVVTYTTVIHTGNPGMRLRPGMTANVTVKIEKREDVLRVPNAALRFRPPTPAGASGGALASAAAGGSRGGDAQAAVRGAMPDSARGGGAGTTGGDRAAGGRPGGRGMRGGARSGGADPSGDLVRRGDAGGGARRMHRTAETGGGASDSSGVDEPVYRPGAIFVLKEGKPTRIKLMTGLTDGAFTEVRSDQLQPGDKVIIGMELSARGPALTPPPGMGGPQFRGPGGRR